MPDSRLTLTIEAQNQASQAFQAFRQDVAKSNELLNKIASNTERVARATVKLTDSQKIVKRLRGEYNHLRTDIHNTAAVTRQFATALQSQIRSQIDAAANLERLRVGLDTISGSAAAAEQQYRRLVDVSRLPGINIENSLRASLQLQALRKSGEEAAEVIREFGNALALSGTAPRELNQVVNAIKQMSGEGKILQEDIAILTTRVAALVPHLKDAFGGTRAKDVREFFNALGVDESEQADQFLRIVLDRLKELPRSGETAANAIENLGDTTQRVQAAIGANFLPLVKESTAALEAFLMQAEQDEGLARNIATVEAFGASWLTVTAALTGVAAAIPAVSAAVAFLFTGPAAIAVGVVATLTAGLVAWKVASQEVESEVDRLNSTIDRNRRALISYQEAVTSGQLGDIQSAQRGIQAQRQQILRDIEGLIAERLNIEEQRDKLQSQINYQEFTGFEPSRARQDRLGELDAQAQNLRKAIEAARFEFLELGQSGRHLDELGKPLVDANVNTEKLTKSIKDLKEELQEEVTFEDVSRGLLGNEADFRKSATALADVEALLRLNTDAYEELEKAAASGNQEAVKGLNDLNKSINELRDTQADRHIDNLSAAFKNLTSATDPSRKQFEAILKSAEAFVATFQGGAAVLQDDVGRASELIGNIRSQLQDLSSDEITLELHAEEAEDLTRALTDFHDLQRDVQEDAGLDAQQSAEKQATAYIRAYRDTIDPVILNLVESVKLLREEVRGSIQDLETLNLRDELRIELNAENLSPVADFFTELVDLQQAAQGYLTRSQIDSLEKRSQALRQYLSDDTANFVAYASDIEAIDETLTDKSLSLLEGAVQAREALFRDEARTQRQVEQAKRQEKEKTYDFDVYLAGLRTKNRHAASQDLIRLEERALDASSSRQLEALTRDTQQFVDMYSERGEAFRDLVADAQDLGTELQEAFDLTEQQKRLEDFQDSVAGVLDNLAGIAIDHVFDSFFGAADQATDAIQTFTDVFRGDIELLENDVTRLARQVEDAKIRLSRLGEDESRRIRQLERQRRSLLARASTGDQKNAERTRQRAQDISFRISDLREDFDVRRRRTQEDADLRRNRSIEDATLRRENFENRQSDDSLLSKLGDSLSGSISNSISSALASGLAGLLSGVLESPFNALIDGIKGLFGGGVDGGQQVQPQLPADTPQQQQQGEADVDGTIKTLTVGPNIETPTVDVSGLIKSAMQAVDSYTVPNVDVVGAIKSAVVDTSYVPMSVEVKGLITSVMLAPGLQVPTVNLPGLINQISVSPDATAPIINPAAVINDITTDPTAQVPQVNPAAVIKGITVDANAAVPSVNPKGEIDALVVSPTAVPPNVDLTGEITNFQKNFVEPIPLKARADVELNLPDTNLLPPIDLGGLRFTNLPPITPRITLPDIPQEEDAETPPTGQESASSSTGGGRTASTPGQTTASIVANEGRRQKVFGSGNPTVQTNITPQQLEQALIEGQKESQLPSDFFNPFSAIADGIQSIAQAVLSSGVSVGGDGVSVGGAGGGRPSDEQVEQIRADLAEDLGESFRSDFIPTLMGNQPGQAQIGSADPDPGDDNETAQAPAAIKFSDAADTLNTVANILSLDALANVAQESTLASVLTSVEGIRIATEKTAEAPLVERLVDAGVAFPNDPQDPTNAALTQSPINDILGQGGLSLFANFDKIDQNLQTLLDAQSQVQGTPDLSVIPGTDPSNPMYIKDVDAGVTRKVEVVGGNVDANVVNKTLNTNVVNTVGVKHVGALAVTQSGEWVMQLSGGGTLPVRVEGGRMVVDIAGGLEGLAVNLADTEVGLRAVGAI